jgi:hypothetical protein
MESGLSSEKYDMNCPIGTQGTTGRRPSGAENEAEAVLMNAVRTHVLAMGRGVGAFGRGLDDVVELPLRCVWSDARDDCSCHSRIPRVVVEQAWQRELAASGDHEGRFFHLIHDGGVWQAYGIDTGEVRGVYCPSHNSQRAARSHAAVREISDVAYEVPVAA